MSAGPASRHLHLVDSETGEVVPSAELAKLQAEVEKLREDRKGLEKDLRTKRRQISELERDKARERLEHPDRELIKRVATYWHRKCKGASPRINPLSPARFDAVAGLAEMEEIHADPETGKRSRRKRYRPEDFKRAIDGAAFDHYVKKRRNGTEQHFDDLELICRDSKQFEEFMARAPYAEPVDTGRATGTLGGEGSKGQPQQRRPSRLEVPYGVGAQGCRLVAGQPPGGLYVRGVMADRAARQPAI